MEISVYKVEKKSIPGDRELVYFFGRDKTRKKHQILIEHTEPYFYTSDFNVQYDDRIKRIEEFDDEKKPYKTYNDKLVHKIITTNSIDVSGIKNKISGIRDYFNKDDCWEDDVLYTDRVPIDIGMKNGVEIPDGKVKVHINDVKPIDFYISERCLFLDIETKTDKGNKVPDPNRARQPVIAISCIDLYIKAVVSFTYKKGLVGINRKEVVRSTILKTPKGVKYKWKIVILENERQMFRKFLEYCKYTNPDFLCAWNGKRFDFPYIINRIIRLNSIIRARKLREEEIDYFSLSPMRSVYKKFKDSIEYVIKGIVLFDTEEAYLKRQIKTTSGKLTSAGEAVLGYGKIKMEFSFNDMYKKRFVKFLYYNAIDVIMDYEIFIKMKQMEHFSGIRRFTGVSYDKIFSNLRVIDFLFLSRAKQLGIILPSARGLEKEPFGGGHVEIPKMYGRLRDICTLDLKTLYPGIMISYNIGFDTYLGKDLSDTELSKLPFEYITSPINTYFRKDKISLVAEILKEFINYRDEFKNRLLILENRKEDEKNTLSNNKLIKLNFDIDLIDEEQKVVKFLTNSVYGVFGNEHFRLYIVDIADTITAIARMIIIDTIRFLESHGWFVNYGDTDSVMYKLKNNEINAMIQEAYNVAKMLNDYYEKYDDDFNLVENYIIMKPEDISGIFFMSRIKGSDETGAKKRYIKSVKVKFLLNGHIIYDPPEIIIKGYIKSNTSVVGNYVIKKVDKLIVNDKDNDYIKKEILSLLRKARKNIKDGKYPLDKLCLRVRASKNFSLYVRKNKDGTIKRNRDGIAIKSKVEHIDAARWTNQWAYSWDGSSNLGGGSIINYVYVNEDNIPSKYTRTDKIALDDDNFIPEELIKYTNEDGDEIVVIDYYRLFNKTIFAPLQPTLREMDITFTDIIMDGQTNSLF
ncbi:hypothetical protein LCGC14_0546620 [marine sediment metagenome]|uniref:DNA-directed DNA polymerase n=1 Tax=marine sediment metagenome TaxID=412755 RepID=A0A0F9S9P3_9ZZZZ